MAGGNRELKKLQKITEQIQGYKEAMRALSDEALKAKTVEFKARLEKGESLDELLPEAYAVVREAAKRILGMEHFPTQIMGGIALHQGKIAEMRTGEGKTLVSTLPAYLNALTGKGVHIVTVNDYLAKRDADQMGQVHRFLGLTVGTVLSGMDSSQRKAAYDCDITYVTNSELGFDYLRDNMALTQSQLVQRGFNFAIIDEVDSVLIDDAGTPLIISGEEARSTKLYEACDTLARRLTRGEDLKELSKLDIISGATQEETGDFILMEKEKRIFLTEEGIRRTERFFRVKNIADLENIELQHHMNLALRANYLLERDKDYVVKDQEVLIVDPQTGRTMPGRRYSEGLHQAIEAKERVRIKKENRTVASVTYQSFFNKYEKKSGMTGTGLTVKDEFREVYDMDIVVIPTYKPVLRIDKEDLVFRTKEEKLEAVCEAVLSCRASHRPVLVGTVSISDSEELSRRFDNRGIRHHVLNAKYHEMEAAIVADAGRRGAVTIATSMAGRGTDIKLDEDAKKAGGLLVIGTERYESKRIDDQLRGRSGRQGDPGESRFYLSLEDSLLRLHGKAKLADKIGSTEGKGESSPALTKAVDRAQKLIESEQFGQRRQMLGYDLITSKQQDMVYEHRQQVLMAEDMGEIIRSMLRHAAEDAVLEASREKTKAAKIHAAVYTFEDMLIPEVLASLEQKGKQGNLADYIYNALLDRLDAIEAAFGNKALMESRERELLLKTVDRRWTDHMEDLEHLRQGIGLMSYAQKDPLKEYANMAFRLFEDMNRGIRFDAAMALLSIGEMKVRS